MIGNDMESIERRRITNDGLQQVVPGLSRLRVAFVNVYYAGDPEGPWVLIDAGLSYAALEIIEAAEDRFGTNHPPEAILLTHGHFDHVGAIKKLVEYWDVPVYAHELEEPYLTGRSEYPPPDPTVGGGAMARLSCLYPRGPIDLGRRIRTFPADGSVPGLPGWTWIHTPGHSPGHVSFFREKDRTLIAGDAFVTVKQESAMAVLQQRQEVHGPPAYFTPDWASARHSVESLARLEPEIAATGHGKPMYGERLRTGLDLLVREFEERAVPKRGRYISQPAQMDEHGIVSVPSQSFPGPCTRAALIAAAAALSLIVFASRKVGQQA